MSVGLNSRSECSLDVTKSRVLRLVQSWPVSSSLSHHFNSCSKLSSINNLMQYSLNSWTAHASGQDTNKHVSQDASKLKSVQKTENKYFRLVSEFFYKMWKAKFFTRNCGFWYEIKPFSSSNLAFCFFENPRFRPKITIFILQWLIFFEPEKWLIEFGTEEGWSFLVF